MQYPTGRCVIKLSTMFCTLILIQQYSTNVPVVPSSTATSPSLSEVERLSLERTAAEEPILTTDLPPFIQAFKDIGTTSAADRSPRTLVLCFDGTGDQFNTNVSTQSFCNRDRATLCSLVRQNSNIIQFFQLLAKGNRAEQMVYYQVKSALVVSPNLLLSIIRWYLCRLVSAHILSLRLLPRTWRSWRKD